ncbi:domain found in IF2B/IF5-domain-containing protein [Mycena amicta]|nr:domain found in IF2B/IF5-domain-containing protein [Mycena amicta]
MASGFVNIRRDVDDKFYRYRCVVALVCPFLHTKIEGKGNGIKTVLPNMADVARALSRPPSYTTKFFGCELGAQTSCDEKNERYILLDGFIDKFVLCKSCKNPETELVILKVGRSEDIIRDCKACGERTGVDMRHKLVTFILKNPPIKARKGKKAAQNGDAAAGVGGDTTPDNAPELDPKALNIAIYKKAEELGIEKKHKTVLILVTIFTQDMVTSEKHQKALLGGIERLVGLAFPDLLPQVPKILMALYQDDIPRGGVRSIPDKDTSKKVRKASEPFLKWLAEAEDDESDEE